MQFDLFGFQHFINVGKNIFVKLEPVLEKHDGIPEKLPVITGVINRVFDIANQILEKRPNNDVNYLANFQIDFFLVKRLYSMGCVEFLKFLAARDIFFSSLLV